LFSSDLTASLDVEVEGKPEAESRERDPYEPARSRKDVSLVVADS
jgi:hypothetical protein